MGQEHTILVNNCLEQLALNGYFAWKNETGALPVKDDRGQTQRYQQYGKPGSADIIGVMPDGTGRHMEVECKVMPDVQKKNQKIHQMMVERHYGVYIVTYSVDAMMRDLEARRVRMGR